MTAFGIRESNNLHQQKSNRLKIFRVPVAGGQFFYKWIHFSSLIRQAQPGTKNSTSKIKMDLGVILTWISKKTGHYFSCVYKTANIRALRSPWARTRWGREES
jgi:hypothetical protein